MFAHLLLLSLLVAPRAEVPMSPYPGCGEPDRHDLCPPDLGETWWLISYIPTAARAGVREAELEVGSGCHADSAWQTTPGRWDVMVAVLDSGIDWSADALHDKVHLNTGELPPPQRADGSEVEGYDLDGNGLVNLSDYAEDPRVNITAGDDVADGELDPSDLIATPWGPDWDGLDNDDNGYTDDIAGWDFMAHDHDPYNTWERADYGTHGTGVMETIGAEGGDGGSIGVCPNCAILPVRIGHAFISDASRVAEAIVFAVDSGAAVINLSIGAMSHSAQVDQALAWARAHDVVIAAAAGDENAYHQNYPAVAPDALYAHSIRADTLDESDSAYSYQSFLNCNNYGPRSDISAVGRGCATAATAMTSGAAGLIVSAARDAGLTLSSGEVRQLITGAADDIWLQPDEQEIAGSYPSSEGWDPFYGYGKLNVARAVERVLDGAIPPEISLESPAWFAWFDAREAAEVEVVGAISARAGAFDYTVEVGTGWEPEAWSTLASGHADAPLEGALATLDIAELPAAAIEGVPEASPDETIQERVARVHVPSITVRVTVTDEVGGRAELRRSFFVQDDPDLLPGYPKSLGSSIEASPVLADMDGDGVFEVIVATSGGEIHALRGDGADLDGYPLRAAPPPRDGGLRRQRGLPHRRRGRGRRRWLHRGPRGGRSGRRRPV